MGIVAARALAELRTLPPGPLFLAWSGGADSTGLLAWLLEQAQARQRGLQLLHVDHGLHAKSGHWAQHCRERAETLGLACTVLAVEVPAASREGREQAARKARYAALAKALPPGGVLLTAHHLEDQAETVLLRLMRGAGLRGLGAMRRLRRFGGGWLWRPMLDQPRRLLHELAQRSGLGWIEDPSNERIDADRNLIRHQVLPRLTERWPAAAARMAASAAQLQQAWPALESSLDRVLAGLQGLDPRCIDHGAWSVLDEALATLVLGHWLETLGSRLPPPRALAELHRWRDPRPDGEYSLHWPEGCLKLWRGRLHALEPDAARALPRWSLHWEGKNALELPHGLGRLCWVGADAGRPALRLGSRTGGERLRLNANGPHRPLRLLLQEAGLPPWRRDRLVMLEHENRLVAALPHWWDVDFARQLATLRLELHWRDPPDGLGCRDGAALNPTLR